MKSKVRWAARDHHRGLHDQCVLELALHIVGHRGRPQLRGCRHRSVGELDTGEAAHGVESVERGHGDAGGAGWYHELGQPAISGCGDEEHLSVRGRFHRGGGAGKGDVVASRSGAGGVATEGVLVPAPGRYGFTGEDAAQKVGMGVVAGCAQRSGHHIGGNERAGSHMSSEGIGHHGQIDHAASTDAATAVLLGHQERRPAQLGALTPVAVLVAVGRLSQAPDLGDGTLRRQEPGGRISEELLIVGEGDFHAGLRAGTRRRHSSSKPNTCVR